MAGATQNPKPTTLSYEAARAFLAERGLEDLEWWPDATPDGVHLYTGSTKMKSLRLDDEVLGASGVIVDGDLDVELIENGEQDFGPFLVVIGNLKAKNVAIAGAPLEVTKSLTVTGAFHGYYNHGCTHVGGDVNAALLIADDYLFTFDGRAKGIFLSDGELEGDVPEPPAVADALDAQYFEVEDVDEGGDEPERYVTFKSHAIYKALVEGLSLRTRASS